MQAVESVSPQPGVGGGVGANVVGGGVGADVVGGGVGGVGEESSLSKPQAQLSLYPVCPPR